MKESYVQDILDCWFHALGILDVIDETPLQLGLLDP